LRNEDLPFRKRRASFSAAAAILPHPLLPLGEKDLGRGWKVPRVLRHDVVEIVAYFLLKANDLGGENLVFPKKKRNFAV